MSTYLIFLILFGFYVALTGFAKYYKQLPINQWSYRRLYFMFAYILWGLGFMASGVGGFFPQIAQSANIFYGTTFFLMVFTPCGLEAFNTQLFLKILRNIAFIALGVLIVVHA